jgi:monoamine oxidase
MPRTPLARALRHIANVAHAEAERAQGRLPRMSRRQALQGAAAVAASTVAWPAVAAGAPSVAIVGAGLAGLSAAWTLHKAGVKADVYEAATRLGGRCYSIRGVFENGQIGEHGGEFIDSDHVAIQGLAAELGLHLDDVLAAQPKGTEALYWFNSKPYSVADAARDYAPIYPVVQDQIDKIGSYDYTSANDYAKKFDTRSVVHWVEAFVPGGLSSRFGQLVINAMGEENAVDAARQSALIVPALFGPDPQYQFDLYYTGSDQRYHVRGGNDQIVSHLARRLAGQIVTGAPLTAITKRGDGTFTLSFQRDSACIDKVYDRVILALPFSVLRRSVDTGKAGFQPLKRKAIQQLGMGASTKFQLQFNKRLWRERGCTGEIRLDSKVFQTSWEVTRAQPGATGILNFWSGGLQALNAGAMDIDALANQCFTDAAPLLPGLAQAWNGKVARDAWASNPWSHGSYTYQPIGYATTVAGVEGLAEGNCFFAGEHTSPNYGYLDAAVSTGQSAAQKVIQSIVS